MAIPVESVDYPSLISNFPWIVRPRQNAILSPDSDGFLCGLLMSHWLDWTVAGFYDGKVLLLKDGLSPFDCVFLDMEIFRGSIRSIGHHMLLYNKNRIPDNWNEFRSCIQPNNIRSYDVCHDFSLKYPLATIHMLLGILGYAKREISVDQTAISALLFVDGTWQNLFQYMENCLSWIEYLGATDPSNPLHEVFVSDHFNVYEMMVEMNAFLRKRDSICAIGERGKRQRGDRLIISDQSGAPFNIVQNGRVWSIDNSARDRVLEFIRMLADQTRWDYRDTHWCWDGLLLGKMQKRIIAHSTKGISQGDFLEVIGLNPVSFAVTKRSAIEYTIDGARGLFSQ
jgi:hypothetical protein